MICTQCIRRALAVTICLGFAFCCFNYGRFVSVEVTLCVFVYVALSVKSSIVVGAVVIDYCLEWLVCVRWDVEHSRCHAYV